MGMDLPKDTEGEDALCLRCFEEGTNRNEALSIPGFRDGLLVASFECDCCGFRSRQVQFAGQVGQTGVRYELTVPAGATAALNRQVLRAETGALSIPELEFEIPAASANCGYLTRGDMDSVAGLLRAVVANLREDQAGRHPETAARIEEFLGELGECISATRPFTLCLDDPAGNSWVGDVPASAEGGDAGGGALGVERYERSAAQQAAVSGGGAGGADPPGDA